MRALLLLACLLSAVTLSAADKPPQMNLSLTTQRLIVCQLAPDASIPAWALDAKGFSSISRTSEELSIVCAEGLPPKDVKQEGGWRVFKVDGPLDFTLTGILVSIAAPLAKAGISIFAISTYNTDYVLVKQDKVEAAINALRTAGHTVRTD
jgi:uncharacterized protein